MTNSGKKSGIPNTSIVQAGNDPVIVGIDDAKFLLIASFRYVLGRQSYAPGLYEDIFKKLYPQLPTGLQEFIVHRLQEELGVALKDEETTPGWLGHSYDVEFWKKFYNNLKQLETDLNGKKA